MSTAAPSWCGVAAAALTVALIASCTSTATTPPALDRAGGAPRPIDYNGPLDFGGSAGGPGSPAAGTPTPDPDAAPAPANDAGKRPPTDAPPAGPPTLTLVSPGGEPKVEMRLRAKRGARETIELQTSGSTEMTGAAMPLPPMAIPPMTTVLAARVVGVGPDEVRSEFVVRKVRVGAGGAGDADKSVRAAAAGLEGALGSFVVDRHGVAKSAEVKLRDGGSSDALAAAAALQDALMTLATPLPAAPIGPGAKWQVSSSSRAGGVATTQTSSYELLEFKGTRGRTKIGVRRTAPPQDAALPGLPAGTSARIESYEASGGGSAEFDLKHVGPRRSEQTLTGTQRISVAGQAIDARTHESQHVATK